MMMSFLPVTVNADDDRMQLVLEYDEILSAEEDKTVINVMCNDIYEISGYTICVNIPLSSEIAISNNLLPNGNSEMTSDNCFIYSVTSSEATLIPDDLVIMTLTLDGIIEEDFIMELQRQTSITVDNIELSIENGNLLGSSVIISAVSSSKTPEPEEILSPQPEDEPESTDGPSDPNATLEPLEDPEIDETKTLQYGDYLQMGTYYGEPILWRCVDVQTNGLLMWAHKIICFKAYDAAGENTVNASGGESSHNRGGDGGEHRQHYYGSNYWADSTLRTWLNSDEQNVTWACGNPPVEGSVTYNPYDDEAGFLTNFTDTEKKTIKEVTLKSLLDGYEYSTVRNGDFQLNDWDLPDIMKNYHTAYSEDVTEKMFLPDIYQAHRVYLHGVHGNVLEYNYYVSYPTQQAVEHSPNIGASSQAPWYAWLRSPRADMKESCAARALFPNGQVQFEFVNRGNYGVRPAFYFDQSNVRLAGEGTKEVPYVIPDIYDCGDNAKCYFDSRTGKLTIYGSGAVYDYNSSYAPWYAYRNDITSIVIEDGITEISRGLFRECKNVKSVTLPKSMEIIRHSAFNDCNDIENVDYGGTEEDWNDIFIGSSNTPLINARIKYSPAPTPTPYNPINDKPTLNVKSTVVTLDDQKHTTSISLNTGAYSANGTLNISVGNWQDVSDDGFEIKYTNAEGEEITKTLKHTESTDTGDTPTPVGEPIDLDLTNFATGETTIEISFTPMQYGTVRIEATYTGNYEDESETVLSSGTILIRPVVSGGGSHERKLAEPKNINNTAKFYYTLDGNKINLSLDGTLNFEETTEKNIIVGCYDNGILQKAELVNLNETINGVSLNDFTIELPDVPEDLTVKAFAWSGFDKCTPLCGAAELTDIPESAFRVTGRVTATSRTDSTIDTDAVDFLVESSDNFDGYKIEDEDDQLVEEMYIGDTDINKHPREIVEAYITKDENDEYKIVKYTPLFDEQTLTITKSDIDFENTTTEKIVTTDGKEIDISALSECYVNDVYADWLEGSVIDFLTDMPSKYSKITLIDDYTIDDHTGDGIYDIIFIDFYGKATVDSVVHRDDEVRVYFADTDEWITASPLNIYTDDDYTTYNFINENGEPCDISELDKFEGKDIYIAFNMDYNFSDSDFYDIILEGAQAADTTIRRENRLSGAESAVVLRYSDKDNTAYLEGDLRLDCDGNMPYDINVNIMSDNEILTSEKIKASTLADKLVFGYESGTKKDYSVKAYTFSLDEKPDKAVISFGEDNGIADINVPVVDADAFKVSGRITDTSRTSDELAGDEVYFRVEKSDCFDDMQIGFDYNADEEYLDTKMNCVGIHTSRLMGVYSQAYIKKNGGDYTIQAIMPVKYNAVELSAEDFDYDKSYSSYDCLYFYPAGEATNSVKYKLNGDISVYVNGVYNNDLSDKDRLSNFLDENNTATIRLIKETKTGSTSTSAYYNLVMIDAYSTAVVEKAAEENGKYKIDFLENGENVDPIMTIDPSDKNRSYTFTLNDEQIQPSELKAGDVLSIAYDVTGAFTESKFYDVLVSRGNIVTGLCTSGSSYGDEFTVNDTTYKVTPGMNVYVSIGADNELYLDCFGRIAYAEETAAPKKLAIFKNIYRKAGGDYYVQIITKEGKEEEYIIDYSNASYYGALLGTDYPEWGVTYQLDKMKEKYTEQVISYRISQSQKLIIDDNPTIFAKYITTTGCAPFDKTSMTIGDIKLTDSTAIIDISDVENGNIISVSAEQLIDGKEYEACGYDRTYNWLTGEAHCGFVIIKDTRKYDSQSKLAVYESSTLDEVDGEEATIFNLLVDGERKQFVVNDDVEYYNRNIGEGDPILFVTDTDSKITDITAVFSEYGLLSHIDYNNFLYNYAFDDLSGILNHSDKENYWSELLSDSQNNNMDMVFGVVLGKSDNDIALVQGTSEDYYKGMMNGTDGVWVNLTRGLKLNYQDANIYTYDFGETRTKLFTDNALQGTPSSKSLIYTDDNGDEWINIVDDTIADSIVLAVARIDGDRVKEIYQIVGE